MQFCNREKMEKPGNGNSHEPRCQEKRQSYAYKRPYRKPTLVDGERIPRRPEQCSLRNSAKKQVYLRYIPFPFICWVMESLGRSMAGGQPPSMAASVDWRRCRSCLRIMTLALRLMHEPSPWAEQSAHKF